MFRTNLRLGHLKRFKAVEHGREPYGRYRRTTRERRFPKNGFHPTVFVFGTESFGGSLANKPHVRVRDWRVTVNRRKRPERFLG